MIVVIDRYDRLTVEIDVKLGDTALHRVILLALPQLLSQFFLRLCGQVNSVGLLNRHCCLLTVYYFKAQLRAHIGVENVHVFFHGASQDEIVRDFWVGTTGTVKLTGFTPLGVVFWGLGGLC